jgi:hypothetical protein
MRSFSCCGNRRFQTRPNKKKRLDNNYTICDNIYMKRKTILKTIVIRPEALEALKKQSRETGATVLEIIRRIVDAYLKGRIKI